MHFFKSKNVYDGILSNFKTEVNIEMGIDINISFTTLFFII